MKKTKAQALETRESLLLAALDTFYKRGVARASLHEIAQAAGLTRGALYWHFKNKEDLFDALFLHIFDCVSQDLHADIRHNAPNMLQSLRQALLNMFERLEHDELHHKFCNILHLKCEHTEENAAIVGVMQRYQQMWHEMTQTALTISMRQGALPADLDIPCATLYIKTHIFGLMQLWLTQPHSIDLMPLARRTIDATLFALIHAPDMRLPPQGASTGIRATSTDALASP